MFKLREVSNSDFQFLYNLWKEAGIGIKSVDREKKEFTLLLSRNPSLSFVALDNKDEIIGVVLCGFNGRRGWIYHLAVKPDCQRNGVGSFLVTQVEKRLEKMGCTKILLGVDLGNLKTVPFYEKNGFSVINDAIYMKKDLID